MTDVDCMPTCAECVSYASKTRDRGDCRINGETTPDRDSERCPSRTFIPKTGKIIERILTMPRELSDKDIAILKKLAPECGDLTCSGSGHMFHSILPPVSNQFLGG